MVVGCAYASSQLVLAAPQGNDVIGCLQHLHSLQLLDDPLAPAAVAVYRVSAGSQLVLAAPEGDDAVGCLQHLHSLQLPDDPQLFGLHPNTSIAVHKQEGRRLMRDVASMQRGGSSISTAAAPAAGAAGSSTDITAAAAVAPVAAAPVVVPLEIQMAGVIDQLLVQLPQPLDRQEASILHNPFALLPCGRVNPMGVVLLQEMDRWVAGGWCRGRVGGTVFAKVASVNSGKHGS